MKLARELIIMPPDILATRPAAWPAPRFLGPVPFAVKESSRHHRHRAALQLSVLVLLCWGSFPAPLRPAMR